MSICILLPKSPQCPLSVFFQCIDGNTVLYRKVAIANLMYIRYAISGSAKSAVLTYAL